jgi:hypothetical protein
MGGKPASSVRRELLIKEMKKVWELILEPELILIPIYITFAHLHEGHKKRNYGYTLSLPRYNLDLALRSV